MSQHSNRLKDESSPYLLQHAHNPVDWYPWGEEALQRARTENKPILVSIGYAACHWCHVMEKESFEDEGTASVMNEHFINIKIDREERPDLDHIYMDAVQTMTGSGGWPLNVFLTPAGKPFYGGTYFPPRPVYNRPSWKEVLQGVVNAYRDKQEAVESQADNLTQHLVRSNEFGMQSVTELGSDPGTVFTQEKVRLMYANIMKTADRLEGGFGGAPKFPQTFTIRFLLQHCFHTKNEEALLQACLSLDKMILGGIYDQLGGGFARYATDGAWLVPHFEKMLYDNALLVTVLCEAFQLTKNPLYERAIRQTLSFVEREMLSPEYGFYAALDADSEGEEGRFYVWDKANIDQLLGQEAPLFCAFYDVTEEGNWEHKTILNIKVPPAEFALQHGITEEELWSQMDKCRGILMQARNRRIRPLLDDKQLLGWNALMNTAYSQAAAALGNDHYREVAVRNMEFLLARFKHPDGSFQHTYKEGVARFPAFLDDYSALIQALLQLQEVTGDTSYLYTAKGLTTHVLDNFSEEETGFFYFTPTGMADIIVRKKEVYDGAVPSGNAVMAMNLYCLGIIFDVPEWRERSVRICSLLQQTVSRYPGSFGVWATMVQALTFDIPEIAIIGGDFAMLRADVLRRFIPVHVLQSAPSEPSNQDFPLLGHKPYSTDAAIFLCRGYTCQQPVNEADALIRLMGTV
ncbi:thioredoxin domain-containing protein [Paraflavitalea sp. CAU 1676]|uniref:thioredoxin domain-containing protein n=1 Tax=Paraflavitalea sp. CAU 1676 TaxID=3032598 RepID=UPI0023DC4879|nr:thioredoxin domain-containing protein [Paraflavitalea sp. CAU 1676]MDF2187206.1 thioredoxin domain-containing protein [Paraflavitalea sp. CAU 1676]